MPRPDHARHDGRVADTGTEERRWIVWRQDDNGNRYEVARFAVRADADALASEMEARGHRQLYWVAALT